MHRPDARTEIHDAVHNHQATASRPRADDSFVAQHDRRIRTIEFELVAIVTLSPPYGAWRGKLRYGFEGDVPVKREFYYQDDRSNKFWTIERVDFQRGSQDDLVQVAVLKTMLFHITQLPVGPQRLIQVFQKQSAQIAVAVDQTGPPLVIRLFHQEIPQRGRQACAGFATGFQVGIEQWQFGLLASADRPE